MNIKLRPIIIDVINVIGVHVVYRIESLFCWMNDADPPGEGIRTIEHGSVPHQCFGGGPLLIRTSSSR